jgi:hypothetical protein
MLDVGGLAPSILFLQEIFSLNRNILIFLKAEIMNVPDRHFSNLILILGPISALRVHFPWRTFENGSTRSAS